MRTLYLVLSVLVLSLLTPTLAAAAQVANCDGTSTGTIPINDLARGRYLGEFRGGLYPDGANVPPDAHHNAGLAAASQVVPLDALGRPDPNGKVVMLSIGMSNASLEFRKFIRFANADPLVDHDQLVIINGATSGGAIFRWISPELKFYDSVEDEDLAPVGVTEAQVQVVWFKGATSNPDLSLPDPNAEAYEIAESLGNASRALRVRYPNLKLVFFASRIYAGYASEALSPEPFAYESAFSVKWLIQAQIDQAQGLGIDPLIGDLSRPSAAPWLAWGPYLWADGETPRSDGLQWFCSDFAKDGTHPASGGSKVVGNLMMDFFLNSPYATPWFLQEGGCTTCEPTAIVVRRPASGNILQKGTQTRIRWTSSGPVGDDVSITLRRGAKSRTITESTPNNGRFRWTIPTNLGNRDTYFITITSTTNPEASADSPGTFTITD